MLDCDHFKLILHKPEADIRGKYQIHGKYYNYDGMWIHTLDDIIRENENALPEYVDVVVRYPLCSTSQRFQLSTIYQSK